MSRLKKVREALKIRRKRIEQEYSKNDVDFFSKVFRSLPVDTARQFYYELKYCMKNNISIESKENHVETMRNVAKRLDEPYRNQWLKKINEQLKLNEQ